MLVTGDNAEDWLEFAVIMDIITQYTKDKKEVKILMNIDCCYSGWWAIKAYDYIYSKSHNSNLVEFDVDAVKAKKSSAPALAQTET